jgi:hypothetical protein
MSPAEIRRVLERTRVVITHVNPDIDACISAFLVWRAAGRPKGLQFIFVQHGEGGDSKLDEGVWVVDTGHGQFDHHQRGAKYPCAATAVHAFLRPIYSDAEEWALNPFLTYAAMQDRGRSRDLYTDKSYEASVAEAFNLGALHQAILYQKHTNAEDTKVRSKLVMEDMLELLDLLYERKLGHKQVRDTLTEKEAWVSEDGAVVLLQDVDQRHTKQEETIHGRKIVVYSNRNSIGVVRTNNATEVDLKGFAVSAHFSNLFQKCVEEQADWFVHNKGYVVSYNRYARGGERRRTSRVDPMKLAFAVWSWLYERSTSS